MEKSNEKGSYASSESTRNQGATNSNSSKSGSTSGMGAGSTGSAGNTRSVGNAGNTASTGSTGATGSTRNTGGSGSTGGSGDNTRSQGNTADNKSNTGGKSEHISDFGNTTGNKNSTGGYTNTGSAEHSAQKKSSNNEAEGNGILSSLGIKKNQLLTAMGAIAGGALLYKGAKAMTGFSAKTSSKNVVNIHSKLKVKRPKAELYSYWRNLENLPNFMSHIQDVEEIDNKKSHWAAEVPGGFGTIEWDAEIIWEEKNRLLSWRSLPDSEIENSGEVRFEDAPGGKSTFVETTISFRPPAGKIGGLAAKLLNPGFQKVVKNDLQEFKKFMEKGKGRS